MQTMQSLHLAIAKLPEMLVKYIEGGTGDASHLKTQPSSCVVGLGMHCRAYNSVIFLSPSQGE